MNKHMGKVVDTRHREIHLQEYYQIYLILQTILGDQFYILSWLDNVSFLKLKETPDKYNLNVRWNDCINAWSVCWFVDNNLLGGGV